MLNGPMRSLAAYVIACAIIVVSCATAWGASLPDRRAYELVSPPEKHGGDVMSDSSRVRVAVDGDAVSFPSLTGFGDAHGTGIATDYLSQRTSNPAPGTSGWVTHGITPPQKPLVFLADANGLESNWVGDFSPDLSTAVFRAWSPVTDEDPNVVNVENLYRRDDLRTAGPGHYQLVSACPVCGSPLDPLSVFAAPLFESASTDFTHVLFSSALHLTADASASPTLYDWHSGTLRSVGILPDSSCGTPPCLAGGSSAGLVADPQSHAISADGSRITFTDTATGQIYQRIDGSQSVAVSASERTDCADHSPCNGTPEPDPAGTQPATFALANVSGTRVFFISAEQLTNDDTDPVTDLYMWDGTQPAGHRLTRISVDHEPADTPNGINGVLGAASDGSAVYFAASGQLVAGKPIGTGNPGIYAWHDGSPPSLTYVGEMADPSADILRDFFQQGSSGRRVSRVTPDGQHLLFMSHSGVGLLSAHGGMDVDQTHCSGGCAELYLYNAVLDTLVCASCNPDGEPPTTDADTVARDSTSASVNSTHLSHSLSEDGRWVFFNTSEALVPEDSNGNTDAYEYDAQTGKVSLLSGGTDPAPSFVLDASPDGRNVFITTRQQLIGWDTDVNYDLYDARVDGGFPNPPSTLPVCTGEGCRSPLSAAPGAPGLGSTSPGGVTSRPVTHHTAKPKPKPVKCRKGSVRKRVKGKLRCVKQSNRSGKSVKRATARRTAR